MTTRLGVRDRDAVGAVDGESGRSSFDGNHPVVSWLLGLNLDESLNEDDMKILIGWMERGHLAWVVIPVNG